jgi:hypothetical protein
VVALEALACVSAVRHRGRGCSGTAAVPSPNGDSGSGPHVGSEGGGGAPGETAGEGIGPDGSAQWPHAIATSSTNINGPRHVCLARLCSSVRPHHRRT